MNAADSGRKTALSGDGRPTFYRDIAPILFGQCAVCHHSGGPAPFSLLTLEDARKHAPQIAAVTQSRKMPPWPPEPGYGHFAEERRLSSQQIEAIQAWVAADTPAGNPSDEPPVPQWPDGWVLGRPDLTVSLPKPYVLAPDGKDVYRNFVISVPLARSRFVRAVELQASQSKAVHHVFIKVDRTSQSRRLDAQDGEPGFPGMNTPAEMPDGQFLTWQPGKLPSVSPPGLAWQLDPGNDLVVQMHLRPTGKPELIQPVLGFYFTDEAPTNQCFKMVLTSLVIDIPPGDSHYEVHDSFTLPISVRALAVLPHAHYLAKEIKAWATLPDGTRKWLLFIRDWDFNWQGDYRYAPPVELPKGTTLSMSITYDNSAQNVRNPHQPPQRVRYGPQSSDEMAEVWFQLLPDNAAETPALAKAYQAKTVNTLMEHHRYALKLDPADATAHSRLALLLMGQGHMEEAEQHLHNACELAPNSDEPHYLLGVLFRQQNQLEQAKAEFKAALRLNPQNYKAHGNLAAIAVEQMEFSRAEYHYRAALRINPDDSLARDGLNELMAHKPAAGR